MDVNYKALKVVMDPITGDTAAPIIATIIEGTAQVGHLNLQVSIVKEEVKSEGATKRGVKTKGVPHNFCWEILDNPNIKAEKNWETEDAEYWTFKTCRQYIKMYHIDKLWPRDQHERQTQDFACKPHNCRSLLFVQRCNEVWALCLETKK